MELTVEETALNMARYSALLGRNVDVHYRAGDICLPATGKLVADSGRSIFLEQHYEQRGLPRNFRWEVPYQYIVRIEERPPVEPVPAAVGKSAESAGSDTPGEADTNEKPGTPQASAAHASGGGGGILPFANRPKTA